MFEIMVKIYSIEEIYFVGNLKQKIFREKSNINIFLKSKVYIKKC